MVPLRLHCDVIFLVINNTRDVFHAIKSIVAQIMQILLVRGITCHTLRMSTWLWWCSLIESLFGKVVLNDCYCFVSGTSTLSLPVSFSLHVVLNGKVTSLQLKSERPKIALVSIKDPGALIEHNKGNVLVSTDKRCKRWFLSQLSWIME